MTDIAIRVQNLSKRYEIYDAPRDRLKQFVVPKLHRIVSPLKRLFSTHHLPLTTDQGVPTYYREFWALKDVSFEIKKGETIGIIGRNGSGKSTLLQLICGILSPTGGKVETNGRIAALLELGSAFNPEFTGRENVYMNAAVLGLNKDEVDERFDDIAAFADIGRFIEQPVKTYSSGMMVRLAFAVSVCVDPDVLVIDEALAVGDAAFQFKCMERMKRLTESGTTLLFVSHDIGMVKSFCHQVIYLEHGREKMRGNPDAVAEQYFLDLRDEQRRHIKGGMPVFRKKSLGGSNLPAFGTELGRIISACFLPDESMKTVVGADEGVRIRIETEYDPDLTGAAMSVTLMDRRMLEIAGKYFFLRADGERERKLLATIEVEFQAKLWPGTYFITLRLESRGMGRNIMLADKLPAALSFEVAPYEPEFLGVVDMGIKQLPVRKDAGRTSSSISPNPTNRMGKEGNCVQHFSGAQEHDNESRIKSFTLSCVVDENPRLYVELILWAICARHYLPQNRYRVIVYNVGDFPQDIASWLKTQRIETRHVAAAVIEGSPHCNKIAPFFDAHDTDCTIVCDSDLYFVDDPAVFLISDRFRAPPNNHCIPPPAIFKAILAESGLRRDYRPGIALFRGSHGLRETHVNNINGGFIAVPARRREMFSSLWSKWARWLVRNRALLGHWTIHVDQVAFALAMEELEEDVELLPPQTNAILQILDEITSVYAFHLSTGHIPDFPWRFNTDRTLNTEGLSEDVTAAGTRLNKCIKEAVEVISEIPSVRDHAEKFLNPMWRR